MNKMGFCDPMGPPKNHLSHVLLEMCFKAQTPPIRKMPETPPTCMPESSCATEGLQISLDC